MLSLHLKLNFQFVIFRNLIHYITKVILCLSTLTSRLIFPGMKVLVKSGNNLGWIRSGSEMSYSFHAGEKVKKKKNGSSEINSKSYKLSFTYLFDKNQDEVFFAYAYPFTYTDLQIEMKKVCIKI